MEKGLRERLGKLKDAPTMFDYLIEITHTRKGKTNNSVKTTIEECRAYTEAAAIENILKAVRWYYQNNPSHTFTARCLGLAETEPPRIDGTMMNGRKHYDNARYQERKKETYKRKKNNE